jgi:hypothetical protein
MPMMQIATCSLLQTLQAMSPAMTMTIEICVNRIHDSLGQTTTYACAPAANEPKIILIVSRSDYDCDPLQIRRH